MTIDLSTPALLFPAISLLLLAYTNRYLTLATLVRDLHRKASDNPTNSFSRQIASLRKRIFIIRSMQILGASSFLLCVVAMFSIFLRLILLAEIVFGLSLILLIASLGASIRELWLSVDALNIQLDACDSSQSGCIDGCLDPSVNQ